ncbi:hypothetical protein [Bacillus thuringiensis]|uniref:hypothetical protein n=1 Tax=Bacillus thuringiensis TaxID=1428 RepID=UPI001EDD1B48|nr:hypothetical protein [Bacillus thuringiensis]MCG3425074.1 hypothetical protein [Bacillus thuringiensis]
MLSGLIVSRYYKSKADYELVSKQIKDERQKLGRFFDALQLELELVKKDLISSQPVDYTHILRTVTKDRPITPSLVKENINEMSLKHLSGAVNVIDEVIKVVDEESLTKDNIYHLESRLIRAKINVLMIDEK